MRAVTAKWSEKNESIGLVHIAASSRVGGVLFRESIDRRAWATRLRGKRERESDSPSDQS